MGSVSWTTPLNCNNNTGVITATPNPRHHFVRWADESANATSAGMVRSVTVTEDATFTAIFEADPQYTVTVTVNGNGTAAADKKSYYEGETAILTVAADNHYHFAGWTGTDSEHITANADGTYAYTIGNANRSFTAVFEEDTKYTVAVTVSGNGTAAADKASYYAGETAVLTASADNHYHFAGWTGTDSESILANADGTYAYTVSDADRTFTAVFEEDTRYTVTVTVTVSGHGTAAADKEFYYDGETAVLTATADEGYTFWQWSDGETSNPRKIVVTEDIELTALFTKDETGINSNFTEHPFTVGDNENRIAFSQANLQYQAATQTFRFAYNQYDYIGTYNALIAADYAGWIDLFGWGTGTQPTTNTCNDCGTYFPFDGDMEDPDDTFDAPSRRHAPQEDAYSTFADWGVNSIINGGNTAGVWRTMTADEWRYLFYLREAASSKFGFATINGVKGLVVLPDDWELPTECAFVSSTQAGMNILDSYFSNSGTNNFTHNIYNTAQWIKMENAGAVFLPAAGSRISTTYEGAGTEGYYWSSTDGEGNMAIAAFFDNEFFYPNTIRHRAQGYSVRLVKELGHTHIWSEPTYVWNDDFSQCTATRVCNRDASHVETETVSSITETTDATCTEDGVITYTANFTNEAFTGQVHTETIAALGHDWGEPTYVWNDDYSQCTATRVCNHDASHVETETVSSVAETTDATCTENGVITYTANFTNEAFTGQVHNETIAALGHDWGEPTYVWNDDYSQCTATRVCNRDASHVETETVNAVTETVEATCTEDGTITYTAVFTNEAFAEQSHTETVAALGHDWGEPTYSWNADYSQCTATRVCNRDASHVEEETVNSVAETTPATDTEDGYITYTATFTNEAFVTQVYVKTLETLPTDIVLKEKETDDYYTWFAEKYNGVTVKTATLNRQFKNGVWSTLCLPFDVKKVQMTALGLNGRVFEFQYAEKLDESTTQIYFAVAQTIQAGKGYVVSANAKLAEKTSFVFANVKINTEADILSGYDITALPGYNRTGNIYLIGTLRYGRLFGAMYFGLKDNKLYAPNSDSGTTMNAYRGFFRSDEPVNMQRVRIVAEGEPVVELEVVNGELEEAKNAVKYIENGVLYIRYNNKVYNAQGAELQ